MTVRPLMNHGMKSIKQIAAELPTNEYWNEDHQLTAHNLVDEFILMVDNAKENSEDVTMADEPGPFKYCGMTDWRHIGEPHEGTSSFYITMNNKTFVINISDMTDVFHK